MLFQSFIRHVNLLVLLFKMIKADIVADVRLKLTNWVLFPKSVFLDDIM